ncbi:MAG: hypothetical protein IJI24_09570 [Lachnospiraceae bacterium]|nr:hypothetical protein [Lachnospiraceae bacterium]
MLRFYHSFNAALYAATEKAGILIDGIFNGKKVGVSDMDLDVYDMILEKKGIFANLSGVLFTHLHPDHFDADLTERLLSEHPDLRAPGLSHLPALLEDGQLPGPSGISGDQQQKNRAALYDLYGTSYAGWTLDTKKERQIQFQDLSVMLLPARHDGDAFTAVPHQSMIVSSGIQSWFIAGDAQVSASLAYEASFYANSGSFTGIFINPLQLASPGGREFLSLLPAEQIYIYHLPLPEDDIFSYERTAHSFCVKMSAEFPNICLAGHMSYIRPGSPNKK